MNFKPIILLLALLCFSPTQWLAQHSPTTPENMDALIELDEKEFEIFNSTKAIKRIRRIITVFNEKGKKYGKVTISESNFYKSKNIKARILDLHDKVLKKLEKKEIIESNVNYGYTLATDNSVKKFNLGWNSFPYKIEYQYEIHYNTLFFWPGCYPQWDDSVLVSTYVLKLHQPISYNVHSIGIEVEPQESSERNVSVLVWKLENVPPRIIEDFMPPENRIQMALKFAPTHFKLDEYMGSFESWQKFGNWYLQLSEGLQDLPAEAKNRIRELANRAQTPLEKIQKLYSYLQEDTRYVALELGVGGWQPYPADWVFRNKYGDCKDLSNFMIAMLNEVGIEAYPVLIRTRDRGIVFPEFPANYFNHAITVVPLEGDTLWLECTADYLSAGHLPPGNEGCHVLIVKDGDSKIVRTPESRAEDNVWKSSVKGQIGVTGQLFMEGTIQAMGNIGTTLRYAMIWNKGDDQKDLLISALSSYAPRFSLSEYQLDNISRNYDQPVRIQLDGNVANYAVQSGNRIFLTASMFNRLSSRSIPQESPEERRFPVYIKYPYTDIDSIEIRLPFGYALEAAPEPQHLQASFGEYQTGFEIDGLIFKYYRYFRINQRLIPVEQYADFRSFLQQVVKNDEAKFVFKKG